MDNTLRQPLTTAQLELLKLFGRHIDDTDWLAVRRIITQYFAAKAIRETDTLWEQEGWNEQTMKEWLTTHQRTPYQPQ